MSSLDRRGQVWTEQCSGRRSFIFLVIGAHMRVSWGAEQWSYDLLDLETGETDDVSVMALNVPNESWLRIA